MRFKNSQECTKSELDIFSVPPTQTSIESSAWNTISAKPNLTTTEFTIPSNGNNYIDLSKTELIYDVEIRKFIDDGHPENPTFIPINDTKISTINNLFHSLFNQVQISFNSEAVENTNQLYSYRAYIENLLYYNKETKDTLLKTEGFYKDDAYNFENFMIKDEPDTFKTTHVSPEPDWYSAQWVTEVKPGKKANSGFVSRRNMFVLKKAQLRGKLHCDVFNMKRYLLNNIKINIVLTRNEVNFSLIGEKGNYKIFILNPRLKVRYALISPQVRLAHEAALAKSNAKYPIDRVVMKNITIAKLTQSLDIELSSGYLPYQVIIGFVDHDAFNGTFDKNPFNFKNFGLVSIQLTSGCKHLPYDKELICDYLNGSNNFLETYNTLFQGLDNLEGKDINLDDFKGGNALYVFNLKPDLCNDEKLCQLEQGSVSVSLRFDKQISDLGEALKAIIFLKYKNII